MQSKGTSRREFMKSCGVALASAAAVPAAMGEAALWRKEPAGAEHPGTVGPGTVVVYPAQEGEKLSTDYEVQVNGKAVPVYRIESRWNDKKYSAAYFDFSGTVTVTIRVKLGEAEADPGLKGLAVLPASCGIRPAVADGVATFTTGRHFDISFEPAGERSPLHLFSNPIEKQRPSPGDPDVVYFGPGIHKPGRIDLKAGQTLYIAGGAVVKGAVVSSGDNISILGRGILDGNDWPHFQGPATRMVWPCDGRNIVIRDIIVRGAWTWTVAPTRCSEVRISHLRICGSRCGNDDGIDVCNSSNVTIRNCFIHTDDDGIAVKGTAEGDQDPKPSENILVEGCTFWIDFANGFRLGAESRARACGNFVARNIDVIHFPSRRQVAVFNLHPEDNLPMENVVFENIRIRCSDLGNLARLTPLRSASEAQRQEQQRRAVTNHWSIPGVAPYQVVPGPGPYIHNCLFKDIAVVGEHSAGIPLPRVQVQGLSKAHDVRGVALEHVTVYGQALTARAPEVAVGDFATQIQIEGEAPPKANPCQCC